MDDTSLYAGYLISKEKFAVLWKPGNSTVKFDSRARKLRIVLSSPSKQHKLEISFGDISQIELRRPRGQTTEFLLFQLFGAPQIYEKEMRGDHDSQWVRAVDFTSMCCIGQSSAVCVEFPQGQLPNFPRNFAYYKENKGPFTLENVSTFSCNSDLVPIVNPPRGFDLPYQILFKINSLLQHGYLPGSAIDVDFYKLVDPSKTKIEYIECALNKLNHQQGCCYEPVRWLTEQYRSYSMDPHLPKSPAIDLDEKLVYIYRVIITPCKVYFCGPEVNLSNRVLRNYSDDVENFLRIVFVDEDMDRVPSTALSPRASSDRRTSIYERILSILRNGIVVGDKKFEFLAFSSSQLRENSVWMFASRAGLTAADIREWMGDFRDIRNVAKYAARIGQSFSSSRETVSIDVKEMEILPDIEIETDGITYCFSDGIGKISAELASKVAEKCGCKGDVPSAFQIRYAGYKGVVAVDPTSSTKLSLRKSMFKYKSENTKLDVLTWSKCHFCFLNRQIITLLSNLGVGDQVFEKMQKEVINRLNAMTTNPLEAQKALELMFPGETTSILREMLACGYKTDDEPFLAMMLRALRASRLMDLRFKSRIFVQNGRSMLGCLDETRTLEYGHVFVQISRFDRQLCNNSSLVFTASSLDPDSFIFEGKVVVAKNPCLHPGDVRVLRAVNVPALHHMVDSVVFPQQGKRPHPNECSGSDLDGDTYFVCWEPDLIPPSDVEPMNYKLARPVVLDHDVTIEEVQEYFVKYMVNDSLGMIANAHTVYADKEPRGASSKQCIELAKLHSMAVDSPKTGMVVQIPAHLHVRQYPDFMEKPDKPSYKSQRVIGKLFREVKDIASEPFSLGRVKKYYDPDMKVHGFEDYIDEALKNKRRYNYKLGVLMDSYGIKTEAEILSGSILDISKPSHRKKDMQPVNHAVMSLRRKARTWFSKGNKSGVCDVYAKASAWYHVTYHHSYRQGMDRDNFLSFPWCICDELVHIKRENASKRALRRSSLQKLIYRLFLWLLFFLCLLLLIFVLINKY